ncbi:MAG TPA: hypothetical protein VGK67_16540 [Myxococcales bacterium]
MHAGRASTSTGPSIAPGLVGRDGTPATTLAGQSTCEASLVGSSLDCTTVQP